MLHSWYLEQAVMEIACLFYSFQKFSETKNLIDLTRFSREELFKNRPAQLVKALDTAMKAANSKQPCTILDQIILQKINTYCSNLLRSLDETKPLTSFFQGEMTAISGSLLLNEFFEKVFKITNLYRFLQKYDHGFLNRDFPIVPWTSIKQIKECVVRQGAFNNYYMFEIEKDGIKIRVKKISGNIDSVSMYRDGRLSEQITFIDNYPIYCINNFFYLCTPFGTLVLFIDSQQQIKVQKIHLANSLAWNGVCCFNRYISSYFSFFLDSQQNLKILFNDNNLVISNQNQII